MSPFLLSCGTLLGDQLQLLETVFLRSKKRLLMITNIKTISFVNNLTANYLFQNERNHNDPVIVVNI